MSARVLNPATMGELGHRGGMVVTSRVVPSRVALARVRRDLFGPVDHTAARALAERELRAQSLLDAERWGFDFDLEIPRDNSRYDWEPIGNDDLVPEPYALRGMPYLRRNSPRTPRKSDVDATTTTTTTTTMTMTKTMTTTRTAPIIGQQSCPQNTFNNATTTTTSLTRKRSINGTRVVVVVPTIGTNVATTPPTASVARKAERTPPQEPRVPDIGETTAAAAAGRIVLHGRRESSENDDEIDVIAITCRRKKLECAAAREPTTPVLNAATRKQSSITDYMKSRKRSSTLNGSTKSIVELPEKIARNAGQIRS